FLPPPAFAGLTASLASYGHLPRQRFARGGGWAGVFVTQPVLLLVVHFLEIGVHDIVVAFRGLAFRRRTAFAARGGLLRLVHRLAQLHRSLGQGVGLGLDVLDIVALQRFLQCRRRGFDCGLLVGAHLVA